MKLQIDIWSDYVCQFCYIGKRTLENAIKKTGLEHAVEINYRSYQLVPNAPTEEKVLFSDFAFSHLGLDEKGLGNMIENSTKRASSLGLDYHFENLLHQSTWMTHRLSKYAKEQGKEKEFSERMFHAHFTENLHFNKETLTNLAAEIGLNQAKTNEVLNNGEAYRSEVESDLYEARQIGVRGVPFYVFNNQYSVSGAQSEELFVELLEKLAKDLDLKKSLQSVANSGETCGPDGCMI